jgi:hypothetical protein
MFRRVEVLVDGDWLEATPMQFDRDLDGLRNGQVGWWGRVRYHYPTDAPFCRRQELVYEDRLRPGRAGAQ